MIFYDYYSFFSNIEWGRVPLEKVIWDESYLNKLALNPFASRNSVCIVNYQSLIIFSPSLSLFDIFYFPIYNF